MVILGQDPYIRPGQATGLAFGVPKGTRPLPPSLRNMMKRLSVTDMDPDTTPFDVSLDTWAERGVLLLNTALTVREGASNSHARVWKPVTDDFLHRFAQYRHETIGPDRPGLVFLSQSPRLVCFSSLPRCIPFHNHLMDTSQTIWRRCAGKLHMYATSTLYVLAIWWSNLCLSSSISDFITILYEGCHKRFLTLISSQRHPLFRLWMICVIICVT